MRLNQVAFCFVVIICLIGVASAGTGMFQFSGSTTSVYNAGGGVAGGGDINVIKFHDPPTTHDITNLQCIVPSSNWGGSSDDSHWYDVTFKIGVVTVGTGTFGYNKVGTDRYVLVIFNDDFVISGYSGNTNVDIVGVPSGVITSSLNDGSTSPAPGNDMVVLAALGGYPSTGATSGENRAFFTYVTSNNYNYSATEAALNFNIDRDASNKCRLVIDNGFIEVVNETSVYSTDGSYYSSDITNKTWDVMWYDDFGNNILHQISFDLVITSYGVIYLNQSSYTEPELIQIDAELITYDFTGHAYTTYLQWRDDVGNWNTVSHIDYNESIGFFTDDPTKSIIGDIDFYKYEIPLRLRAVLIDFNKNTYVSTTIAESNTVLYNPPAGALYLVTGTVVNADTDAVVTGATVSVTGPMSQSDTTNVNGRFYLYLADGTYTFNTTKSGYENNVDTGIIINSDTSGIEIPLVPVQTDEGVVYGTITDSDTKNPLNDVHVIFSNATDTIHAYSASNGYYEAEGFNNDSVYAVRALKTGYYSYNGSITTETSGATHKSFDMVQTNYSATPIPTSVSTYPGGEGYEWTNDDIVTMLRILVPGIFLMMLIFLLLAVMMGFMPNNGGNQGGNSGLGELWRRK